ncbi:autotransporter outer membrane beta-barrel domain-containing protein, partial [Escherichia coli]
ERYAWGGILRVAKTTIGGNLENGGTVQMNSEGGKPGNVLTVNGNYTGNNGLMTFNATLGGDNSPTDKMNVKGDTQGNTRVRVDNIGGVGAQTVNGIELIEVGGNSAGMQMHEILSDFARMIPAALDNVKTSLPTDFPENVVTAVETNVLRLHGRLSREYGSK